jgi:hypothetical protein
MLSESRLYSEMRDLSESFDGFYLARGEEVELCFTPHAGTDPVTMVRYQDIGAALAIPLAYGPSCEFYVVLTESDCEFPTPADLQRLLVSWRMRERTDDEIGLDHPVGQFVALPFREPSLEITNISPAGDDHVYEASFYYYRSHYSGSKG